MKYTLLINQKQALELGITNLSQASILGLIADAHTWATPEIIGKEVYYWTARQAIASELPILDMKPDTIYRHLKSLVDLGLIDYEKVGKKDCVRLTKKGKSYYVGNESELSGNSEMNPKKLGNKSEKNSEINPTYQNTNLIRATKDKSASAIKIADYLLSKIISINPSFKKPNLDLWVKDIDKALRIDNRTENQLIDCINWIYSDEGEFWQRNILSGKKLREKFDTMNMQVITKPKTSESKINNIYNTGLSATEIIKEMERRA